MRYILLIILFTSIDSFAHVDTVINIGKNGELAEFPNQYQPAKIDLIKGSIQLGKIQFNFPECVSSYLPSNNGQKIEITSSWYHDKKVIGDYMIIKINPEDAKYHYETWFTLNPFEPMFFSIVTNESGVISSHRLEIEEQCINAIKAGYWYE